MTTKVSLRSRLPEIITELGTRVDPALLNGARHIAEEARGTAPVASGELRDSIDAQAGENNQAKVVALFYWYFLEYGTRFMPAHPFMVSAAERMRETVENEVRAALRNL